MKKNITSCIEILCDIYKTSNMTLTSIVFILYKIDAKIAKI